MKNSKSRILAQAAEAIIYQKGNNIIKDRIKKSYRIPEIDIKIRKQRTKSESKLLLKASEVINCPVPIKKEGINRIQLKKDFQIIMPFIEGKKISENLEKLQLKEQKAILNAIGQDVAKLHEKDIIHGDLTTSNMILRENEKISHNKFRERLNELKKLKLPKEDFAIFGSGPLAIRGIRESKDIDIIVKENLWKKLTKKYSVNSFTSRPTRKEYIKIGDIEIYPTWRPWIANSNQLIDDAEIMENMRFVKLEYVIKWKKKFGRDKDKKDIELIKEYQSKKDPKIFFIDFGLGYISKKIEDKAVDIHLLKQALEAKHFKNWEVLFEEFEKGYKKNYSESKKILERLKAVEKRGRYKH